MHCLDCLSVGKERDAVGVCHSCGAGVCFGHAAIVRVNLVRIGAILRQESVDPPAREVLCPTCRAARLAASQPSAASHRSNARHQALTPDHSTERTHPRWGRLNPTHDVRHEVSAGS
jgi:hypothetical protein